MPLPVVICLYFFHCSVRQYVDYNLGRQSECVDKGLTIRQHIDLPLGVHVVLEHFLLLFGECVDQCISGFHKFIQSLLILTVALEAAFSGTHIAEVKVFQYQHLAEIDRSCEERMELLTC